MTLALMALGGKGVISVFSNALPRQMHDLAAAMLQGDLDTARALNNQYLDLMDGFFLDVNPIPIKEALYQMGLIGSNFCRLPLTTMTEEGGGEAPCHAARPTSWCKASGPGVKERNDGRHDFAYSCAAAAGKWAPRCSGPWREEQDCQIVAGVDPAPSGQAAPSPSIPLWTR